MITIYKMKGKSKRNSGEGGGRRRGHRFAVFKAAVYMYVPKSMRRRRSTYRLQEYKRELYELFSFETEMYPSGKKTLHTCRFK